MITYGFQRNTFYSLSILFDFVNIYYFESVFGKNGYKKRDKQLHWVLRRVVKKQQEFSKAQCDCLLYGLLLGTTSTVPQQLSGSVCSNFITAGTTWNKYWVLTPIFYITTNNYMTMNRVQLCCLIHKDLI